MANQIDNIQDILPNADDIELNFNEKICKKLASGKKYRVGNVVFYADDKISKIYTEVFEKFFSDNSGDYDEITSNVENIHSAISICSSLILSNKTIEDFKNDIAAEKSETGVDEFDETYPKEFLEIIEFISSNYEIKNHLVLTHFDIEYKDVIIIAPLISYIDETNFEVLFQDKLIEFLGINELEMIAFVKDAMEFMQDPDEDEWDDEDDDEWDDDEEWDDDDEEWDDDDEDDDDDDDEKPGKIHKL